MRENQIIKGLFIVCSFLSSIVFEKISIMNTIINNDVHCTQFKYWTYPDTCNNLSEWNVVITFSNEYILGTCTQHFETLNVPIWSDVHVHLTLVLHSSAMVLRPFFAATVFFIS